MRYYLMLLLFSVGLNAAPTPTPTPVYIKASVRDQSFWPVFQRYNSMTRFCAKGVSLVAYVCIDSTTYNNLHLYCDQITKAEWDQSLRCQFTYSTTCARCR